MIELTHVQKVVANTAVLDIAELTVAAGELAAVVGLNSVGKETLLGLLSGQTQPTAGTVRVAGLDPAAEKDALTWRVGVLPPQNGLYPRLSARQNLAFYANLYGLPGTRVDAVLAAAGLSDRASTRADKLSPPLARRLAFGRAILHEPPVLLLADPFADCDGATVGWLSSLLRELADEGTAVLIIADETNDIARLCHTIFVLEDGRLRQSYTPGASGSENLPFKIPARLEGKVALLNPADILYAMTEDGRTLLVTENGRVPTHLTLSDVEARLAHSGFFRAHRSYLVNLQHISEVIAYTRNSYTLMLDNGDGGARAEIPLSKNAARDLRALLDF